jgi:hypothetical protein
MNVVALIGSWAVLASIVIVLAIYRKMLSSKEDDSLHLAEEKAGMVMHQAAVAHRLELVDRWGKSLTLLVVLFGLFIAGIYLYSVWQQSTRIVTG